MLEAAVLGARVPEFPGAQSPHPETWLPDAPFPEALVLDSVSLEGGLLEAAVMESAWAPCYSNIYSNTRPTDLTSAGPGRRIRASLIAGLTAGLIAGLTAGLIAGLAAGLTVDLAGGLTAVSQHGVRRSAHDFPCHGNTFQGAQKLICPGAPARHRCCPGAGSPGDDGHASAPHL